MGQPWLQNGVASVKPDDKLTVVLDAFRDRRIALFEPRQFHEAGNLSHADSYTDATVFVAAVAGCTGAEAAFPA